MNSEDWENVREELVRNSDEYRVKHATWKGAYYAGCLTVCGIALAMSPLLQKEGPLSLSLSYLLSLLCVVSCACCLWNMRIFIRLYDALGYDEIPEHPEQITAYYERHLKNDRWFKKLTPAMGKLRSSF
ncbi:MAG: hypothetical protein AB7E73_16095 [Burkholderiales bacterium]